MKHFGLHYNYLVFNNFCVFDEQNFHQKCKIYFFNIIQYIFLINVHITSSIYALIMIQLNDFENFLYAIFQVSAFSITFVIVVTFIHYKDVVQLIFQKMNNSMMDCELLFNLLKNVLKKIVLIRIFLGKGKAVECFYISANRNGTNLFIFGSVLVNGGYILTTFTFVGIEIYVQSRKTGFIDYQRLYKPYKTW